MLTSEQLKKIRAEARPFIQRQMEDAKVIAGFRDVVTTAGGDWGALKAVIKAEIQDEDDDSGEGKKIGKVVGKAEWTRIYADMLGLSNMNEKNSFAEGVDSIDPQLLAMLVEGSQTEVGRTIIFAALKAVQDGETDFQPDTGEVHDHPRHGAGGAEDEAAVATVAAPSSAQLITGAPEDAHSPHANVGLAGPAFVEDAPQANIKPATIPHPVEGTTPTSTADGDESSGLGRALVVADNVVPIKKRLTFNDPAHAGCLEPERCGGFSNLGLCQKCREATEQGQVA